MNIDPKTIEDRLNDPNNLLNRLFRDHSKTNQEVIDVTPINQTDHVDPDDPNRPLTPEELAEFNEEALGVPKDEATSYLFNLRKRRELPTESAVITHNSRGKRADDIEIPVEAKVMMGTMNRLGASQESVAQLFGVTQPSVGNVTKGKKDGAEVLERIEKNITKVTDKVLDKLLATIDSLDEEKIDGLKPTEQAAVASQLSKIVGNLASKNNNAVNGTTAQLIIYAPTQVTENRYETIEVQDQH